MSKKYVRILYPEDRVIPAIQVTQWAQDAMANEVGISAFPDITLKQAMLILTHFGKVTFANYEPEGHTFPGKHHGKHTHIPSDMQANPDYADFQ